MKITRCILTASLLSWSALCLQADSLNGNGSWQSWSSTVLNTATSGAPVGPYWNGASGDGSDYNIGWCLTGGGNCHIANPPGALSYYGNGNAAASNMYFTNSGSPQEVILRGLFSNQNGVPPSGTDYFGWYSISNGVAGPLQQLLNSNETVGTVATFSPTAMYGLYLENVQSPGAAYTASYYWLSNAGLNYGTGTASIDAGTQHFSIFGSSSSSTYYLGLEDTTAPTSDFDYNDMVVQLQPAPEPTALAFMGIGLALLGLARRRP